MRPAFPTRERSLSRSSRWRESMPQQAQIPAAIAMLQRPRRLALSSVASVLPAASSMPALIVFWQAFSYHFNHSAGSATP